MQHRMAVRTDGNQVSDRVDLVCARNFRQGLNVMNVNEAFAEWAVILSKIKTANYAGTTVMKNTSLPSCCIPLICVHQHLLDGSLNIGLLCWHLVWIGRFGGLDEGKLIIVNQPLKHVRRLGCQASYSSECLLI